jgi:hypothetical protein
VPQYDEIPKEELAKRVRDARIEAGFATASAAARFLGYKYVQQYIAMEKPGRSPSFASLHKLINVGGFSAETLFAPYVKDGGEPESEQAFDGRYNPRTSNIE